MNKTLFQFFEWYCPPDGKHWQRLASEAPRLAAMGITAVWLPPAYKGMRGVASEGYDVYDIYDLGEFDQKGTIATKYGTRQEYIDAIATAQQHGLEVYADIVLNHMGGAEKKELIRVRAVDACDRTRFITDEMEVEAYTRFSFPGRKGCYSDFEWDHHCFTGIDHAEGHQETAIYKIINEYGSDWKPMVHTEKGNFDFLMLNDIETRNPAVRQELKRWGKWYYETAHFDGVRLDAVKHIDPAFFNEWLDYMREIKPGLQALGEYWLSDDLPVLLQYIDATNERMSLFDAPLHHNFSQASILREAYDLRTIFHDSLVAVRPRLAVTFVDNHDTQPLQSLEEYTEQWFKPHAYALILLRQDGYPCIFYPDMYGTCYSDTNKQGHDCDITIPVLDCLPALLWARKRNAYGLQQDYFDDPHCIGWTRRGLASLPGSGCAVLVSNDPGKIHAKRMKVGEQFAGRVFYDCLNEEARTVYVDHNGFGYFHVQPASVAVWIPGKR